MTVAWHRAREPLLVLAITLLVGFASQRWTGLDTPDSSFYATLGVFGDQVTDRAPEDSYYWTRLGYIAPVQLLTSLLGIWPGFAVYRLLLLLLLVGATYITVRRFTGIVSAGFLAVITALSTVVLSYLGNPYITGSVMAGTAVLVACAMFESRWAGAAAGVTLGWLVMVYPPGALLAGTIWLVLRIQSRTRLLVPLLIAAGTTLLTFGLFLLWGRVVFPGKEWFRTYLDANARIDYSVFAVPEPVWLKDISLIVPVAILVVTVIAWATHRREVAAQRAFVLSLVSLTTMFVISESLGGYPLQSSMYQSMLWPPALIALALVTTLALPDRGWTRLQIGAGILAVLVVTATGFATPGFSLAVGWLIAVAAVAVFLIAGYKGMIGAIAGLAILLSSAQALQNSRGNIGLFYLSPYAWAFASNPIVDRIRTAVEVEDWVLANTRSDDQILLWVDGQWVAGDRELYVVAGMQLWGENLVTLDPTLTDNDVTRLNTIRPTVLAMYGQSMDAVLRFWSSIPAANRATVPVCDDFAWAPNPASEFTVTQGHACLTRLTWS